MYRFRTPELFLGCFLAIAVFALGMLFIHGTQSKQIALTQSSEKLVSSLSQTQDSKGFWQVTASDPTAAFTFCLVIIAVVQAVFFVIQLELMRRSMKFATIAASAAAKQADIVIKIERPYIFVLPVNEGASPFDPKPKAFYFIRNYGRTPAIVQRVSVGLRVISDFSAVPDYRSLFLGETSMVIAPEFSPPKERPPSSFYKITPFDPEDLAAVAQGAAKLCLVGLIEYRSIQNEKLETGFCFEYFADTSSWNVVGGNRYNYET